jgi:hypothetical protein
VASLQRERHRTLAVEARAVAEALLDADGSLPASNGDLARELREGWLAAVAEAAPAGAA